LQVDKGGPHLAEDIEQEEVDVVVERLVVEEQLGEVAQVLAERLLLAAVDLPGVLGGFGGFSLVWGGSGGGVGGAALATHSQAKR
jgi:hypothetical protein